jgi:hypothetical protein
MENYFFSAVEKLYFQSQLKWIIFMNPKINLSFGL